MPVCEPCPFILPQRTEGRKRAADKIGVNSEAPSTRAKFTPSPRPSNTGSNNNNNNNIFLHIPLPLTLQKKNKKKQTKTNGLLSERTPRLGHAALPAFHRAHRHFFLVAVRKLHTVGPTHMCPPVSSRGRTRRRSGPGGSVSFAR